MNIFKKYKGRMIVSFVAIILVVIIGITSSGRKKLTGGEVVLGNILSPIQNVFSSISNGVSDGLDSAKNVFTFKKENEKLKEENIKLKDQVRKQEIVISRKDFLKKEYDLLANTKYNLVKAEVIGKDPGNWFEKFMINKGEKDGIKKGDIIVQGSEVEKDVVIEGLVGRVIDVGDNWSKVASIVDGSSSVSLTIARTQEGGIGKGNLEGQISGQLFNMKTSVLKGDKVFTSGLGGAFYKDLYIGEVSKVTKKSSNLLLDIEITPVIQFNKLRDVFVIKKD